MIEDTQVAPRRCRDSQRALEAAQERLAVAQRVAAAVETYHEAADRIDDAQSRLGTASADRLCAIRALRGCKLTISEIGELTGLSASRVQALAREDADS